MHAHRLAYVPVIVDPIPLLDEEFDLFEASMEDISLRLDAAHEHPEELDELELI